MARQSIDTDRVMIVASKLSTTNSTINGKFQSLQSATRRLEVDWKSNAGSLAHTTMYQLFGYSEARFNVLQNYKNMLEQQVNPSYIDAEDINTKLADKFK